MSHMCCYDNRKMIPKPVIVRSVLVCFAFKELGSAWSTGIYEKRRGGVVWGSICSLFANGQSLEITS